jgi:hypothetical protein
MDWIRTIIVQFNQLIFTHFSINIHKALTLPALAMKIYKTHYMVKDTIYQILGRPEVFIRESYTGGAVDVYKPHNIISSIISNIKLKFKKLFYYDVNSLYPFIMASKLMPMGLPLAFDGDIREIEPNAYGFFHCKITSPDYLDHPILQRRIKTNDGLRTIAGLGSWTGWINSDEMDNAIKFGYTFEILKGYQFETGDLFSKYVNKMYDLRLQYPKGSAMNLIAKLLMNSLYGKFGMKLDSQEIVMFDTSTIDKANHYKEMLNLYGESILDYIKIDDTFLILKPSKLDIKYDEDADLYHGLDINIAIASAITAGARIQMSFFKNNPDFELYYSDTDSAVIDKALPSFMVGSKLGQVKLEHVINSAVFLAPKVYGLITENGTEIIKIKGITQEVASELHVYELLLLLAKDSTKEFTQERWFKKTIEGEITVKDIAYTLKVTSNKRKAGYITQDGVEILKGYEFDEQR